MRKVKDILEPELAKGLYHLAIDTVSNITSDPSNGVITWTNYGWEPSLYEGSNVVNCYLLGGGLRETIIDNLIEKEVFLQTEREKLRKDFSTMIYVWFRHSYINLHNDDLSGRAVTIYLNPEWEYKEGGFLHWYDDNTEEWKTIIPEFNLGVVNNSNVPHATTPVTSLSQFRVSFQGFLKE